jgi:4-hydroxy-2-oxoheptanedioate aldolase
MDDDMTTRNPLRAAWAEGRAALGLWLALDDAGAAELAAAGRPDYLCIDRQHGLAGFSTLVGMLRAAEAAGCAPVVRVSANDEAEIMRALDAGARGIVVPLVESGAEAARAVAACRYPPDGVRSYGPIRAAAAIGSGNPAVLGADPVCAVMIETVAGLERMEEIAATPGLDAVYVGPADLAVSLGLPPGLDDMGPEHRDALAAIRAEAHRHGLRVGIQCHSGALAARRIAEGFDMVTVAQDSIVLAEALGRELEAARVSAPVPS